MSLAFDRTDTSLLGRWWWTVDRWTVILVILLFAIGAVMTAAASPAVAERIGYDPLYFVRRQLVFIPLSFLLMIAVSLLSRRQARQAALIGVAFFLFLTALTYGVGVEVKGARRWLELFGFSLQPSEFLKPCLAVATGWLLAQWRHSPKFPGRWIAVGVFAVAAALMVGQPDLGMTLLASAVFCGQLFLAGLSASIVAVMMACALVGMVGAYFAFEHVQSRIDRFLDPSEGDNYQVQTALEAFSNGGLFGRGPGEGLVKDRLPDAHSDFIFAVAGEELGLIFGLVIVARFALLVLRGLARLLGETNLFVIFAASGLLLQIAIQAFINMASALHLMPTKGMTLPFISYGGSSLLALGLAMGLLLALTRKRIGQEEPS